MPPTTTTTTTTTTTMPPTTTTTTTMPPTTTTTIPLGVEKGYLCFRINKTFEMGTNFNGEWVPTNSEELAEDLRAQLDEAGIQDRYAGIVLTFGVSPASTQGIRNAELFSQFVLPALAPMFDAAATREFWDGRSRTGNWETSSGRVVTEKVDDGFRVDIYLLDDDQGSPALAADHKPDCG